MKKYLVKISINYIKKYKDYSNEKLEIILYGLEGLYSTLTKFIATTLLAIVLNITKEYFYFMAFYFFIRIFAGGFHAKNNLECWITSTISFTLIPYLIKILTLNNLTLISLITISLFCFLMYAPADTQNKPMIRANIRKKNKILTILTCFIYITLLFTINNRVLINAIAFSLIYQSILIVPITYKIFKIPYMNYKNYNKATM